MTAVLAPPVRICVSCGSVRDEVATTTAVAVNGKLMAGVVCADQEACFAASDERWVHWPRPRRRARVAEDIAAGVYADREIDADVDDPVLLAVLTAQRLRRSGAIEHRYLNDACHAMFDAMASRPLCTAPGYLVEALIGAGLLVDIESPAVAAHVAYEMLATMRAGADLHVAVYCGGITSGAVTEAAEAAALTAPWSPWEACYRAAEVLVAGGALGMPGPHWVGGRMATGRTGGSRKPLLSVDRDGTAHAWDHQASTWVPRLEQKP